MPFEMVRNDITKMNVDAIVNAANRSLLGGGGVDGAIHRAAGPELLAECRTLNGCEVGQAKLTRAYRLPCRYVIHTVGPVWEGGTKGERELLASCYRSSLELAAENGCDSIAFPLISCGTFGYPKAEALRVAADTVEAFLADRDMTVYLVVFGKDSLQISEQLYADVKSFIDDHYVEKHSDSASEINRRLNLLSALRRKAVESAAPIAQQAIHQAEKSREDALSEDLGDAFCGNASFSEPYAYPQEAPSLPNDLERELNMLDESFSQMLLRKIDESGMTDVQCYKKANISRKLFSKIRGDVHYKPSKPTALAFAIALELPLDEVRELLTKAGFALSRSSKFDVIIEYFIRQGRYDVFEINETLFAFDQALLGS